MKITINLLQLHPPGRVEGVTTYVRELIQHLSALESGDSIVVLRQPGLEIDGLTAKNVELISVDGPTLVGKLHSKARTVLHLKGGGAQTRQLQKLISSQGIDVIHYPFSTIPAGDYGLSIPIVLSVMDLQHEYFPELFSAMDLMARRQTFQASSERADRIITISEYTKQTMIEKFKTPATKVTAIHLAGDVSTTPAHSLKLPSEYMYYPAADWKHKNHLKLYEAMHQLKQSGTTIKLVLTGVVSANQASHKAAIAKLGLSDDVVHLGQVSYDEVSQIYRSAKMLIYPSLFEGFGLPPLEAMSVGLPVACANTSSLPEIVGQAAELFDPSDAEAIAASIKKVWSDNALREKLIKLGHQQASKFSWERTAKDTLKLYNQAYEAKS